MKKIKQKYGFDGRKAATRDFFRFVSTFADNSEYFLRIIGYGILLVCLIFALSNALAAQSANVPVRSEIFSGNRTPGAAQIIENAPSILTLEQAVQIAITNNLSTLAAREGQTQAQGERKIAFSGLLPNISANAYQLRRNLNLRAQGVNIPIPGFNPNVSSFNSFDARASVVQAIFNLSAIRNVQAANRTVKIAGFEENVARQQVTSAVTLAYLEVQRSRRQIEAAEANLKLADELLKLAEDQRTAGIATGIDVARAGTRVSENTSALTEVKNQSTRAKLEFQRIVGLPQGADLTLTDELQFVSEAMPTAEIAVQTAFENRYEVRIAEEFIEQKSFERRAAKAERYPRVDFVSDYGASGNTPFSNSIGTYAVGVRVNMPIYNGGATGGRVSIAKSRERQAELELGNLRGTIAQDARFALVDLDTAIEQVRTADNTLQLASRELELARGRYSAGVGENIELTNAQTSIENARAGRVNALARYNAARINLAAALGRAETFRF